MADKAMWTNDQIELLRHKYRDHFMRERGCAEAEAALLADVVIRDLKAGKRLSEITFDDVRPLKSGDK